MKWWRHLMAFSLLVCCGLAEAQIRNDVPSCYQIANLESALSEPVSNRELVVVIDATFFPDMALRKSVRDKISRFLKEGDRVSIISFSAYVADNYTNIHFSGWMEGNIEKRNKISKKMLTQFDSCRGRQQVFMRSKLDETLAAAFKVDNSDVPRTEIIVNLSRVVAPVLNASKAERKILLLVSDMFENSDVTSFYSRNQVKAIDPVQELEKVKRADMIASFGGAEVYVAGAGWVSDLSGFRGSKVMDPIRNFWKSYFEASSATMIAFGQPMLIEEL